MADIKEIKDTKETKESLLKQPDVQKSIDDEFKKLNHDAMCVIRTGDFSPYSNVMLACGVAFN